MKMCILFGVLILCPLSVICQLGNSDPKEPFIELSAEQLLGTDSEDEELIHEKIQGRFIDLNQADLEDLLAWGPITVWQAQQLLLHRKLFGPLIHINELQAVPGWSANPIRSMRPFIVFNSQLNNQLTMAARQKSSSQFIFRTNGFPLKSKSKSSSNSSWLGSAQKILLQYRWEKAGLKAGFTAEKDPGEPVWKKGISKGFDFLGVHVFLKKKGFLQSLAIGDFTVNMGQGLIQWQSMAFRKSSEITWTKRQGPVFRPHRTPGEYNFHRGFAVELGKQHWGVWLFASRRLLTANLIYDSLEIPIGVSSVNAGGYHRTVSERADKNSLRQLASGFRLATFLKRGTVGVNGVGYLFSFPFLAGKSAYQLYRITGKQWMNLSGDISFTYHNCHAFGEFAIDKRGAPAFIAGALLSADPKLDLSLMIRMISPQYQSFFSNAFTEGTHPTNEHGIFLGLTVRPDHRWILDAYTDLYQFPWLRYGVNVPASSGQDFLLQLRFKPDRKTELTVRIKQENKMEDINETLVRQALKSEGLLFHRGIRIHVERQVSSILNFRARLETNDIRQPVFGAAGNRSKLTESGLLCFIDLRWKPFLSGPPLVFRGLYFDTDSYKSRIYAYEPGIGANFSIPAFYGRGISLMAMATGNLGRYLSVGARASLSTKSDRTGWFSDFRTFFALDPGGLGKLKKKEPF